MTALYCVFGNPVAHSRSPDIHHAFAAQQGDDLRYEKREAPLGDFAGAVNALRADGGLGANVTVPFKEQAYQLCGAVTERADLAGAVNTLWWEGDQLNGDNTDGAGGAQESGLSGLALVKRGWVGRAVFLLQFLFCSVSTSVPGRSNSALTKHSEELPNPLGVFDSRRSLQTT